LKGVPERTQSSDHPTGAKEDNKVFTDYTGVTHTRLLEMWTAKPPDYHTCCIDFVIHYSNLGFIGRTVRNMYLNVCGGSAFIRPSENGWPHCGDMFMERTSIGNHVGVCLDCDGINWTVVEAGQGTPGKDGFEVLLRRSRPYNPANIVGWIDLDMWLDRNVQIKDGAALRLEGKWTVKKNGETWYYTFTSNLGLCYQQAGRTKDQHAGVGTWSVDVNNVTISLDGEGDKSVIEVWPLPLPALNQTGKGTTRTGDGPESAVSMQRWDSLTKTPVCGPSVPAPSAQPQSVQPQSVQAP